MRVIVGLCLTILLISAGLVWRATQQPTHFGEFIGAPSTPVADLIGRPQAFLGKTILVQGDVREQCKTMGCHFFLAAGEKTLRVGLEHLVPKAPMREGRPARVEGQVMAYGDSYQLVASAVEFQ